MIVFIIGFLVIVLLGLVFTVCNQSANAEYAAKSAGIPMDGKALLENGISNPQELESFLVNHVFANIKRTRLIDDENIRKALKKEYREALKVSGFYKNTFVLSIPHEVLEEATKTACKEMADRVCIWIRGGSEWEEPHAELHKKMGESLLGSCEETLKYFLYEEYSKSLLCPVDLTREEFDSMLGPAW